MDATTVTECLHACGSFSCSAAAAAVAEMDSAAMAAETTAASGSSCCSAAAADSAATAADADLTKQQIIPETYNACPHTGQAFLGGSVHLVSFLSRLTPGILFPFLFFLYSIIHTILQHTFLIDLVNRISINDQLSCQLCSILSLRFHIIL